MVTKQALTEAVLQWYQNQGLEESYTDAPVDRTIKLKKPVDEPAAPKVSAPSPSAAASPASQAAPGAEQGDVMSTREMVQAAKKLAEQASTVEELQQAIAGFSGFDIRKTATNMVFCDGNPKADIMLVGEAPGADEDRQGKPFVGVSGQLLDRILACIGIARDAEEGREAIYISNILNWRPPGNRTPTAQEMEIAQPFIEKHIELIAPKILIFSGGVAAQTLLHTKDNISRLRGKFHEYKPQTIETDITVPAIATYHPAYLLRTPSQKARVWQDMLMIKRKLLESTGI